MAPGSPTTGVPRQLPGWRKNWRNSLCAPLLRALGDLLLWPITGGSASGLLMQVIGVRAQAAT